MNTKTQIKTDRLIGIFNSLFVNIIVRLLGKVLRIDHNLNKNFKTIAVCKYKGMGSIIQSTKLLQSLRNKFPDSRIIFISTNANKGVLMKINIIDSVLLIDDKNVLSLFISVIKLLYQLWKLKIDVYIDLEIYSNFSSLITTLSIAKNRLGFYRQASHYRMGIYTHMMYYNIKAPIANVYLQMSGLLNCTTTDIIFPPLNTTIEKEQINIIVGNSNKSTYVVINPNASDLRIERRWDKNNFVILIDNINELFPEKIIVLIGGENEADYVNGLYSNLKYDNKVINLSGKTNLDELIGVIKYAELLITNDTGPMHIAFALNTKTLALFGPCSPNQYGHNQNTFIVYKNLYCSPCVHEFDLPPCKGNNQCMKQIKPDDVLNLIIQIFSNKFDSTLNYNSDSIIYQINDSKKVLGISLR